MSNLGEQGTYCIGVLWALTAVVLVFLVLRVCTRIVCHAPYGVDDAFYVAATGLMAAYSAVTTVACLHGYGRDNLDGATKADATFWQTVAQTISTAATGTAKVCLGFFLLRLTTARWHKIAVWIVMVGMVVVSTLGAIFTFVGCHPVAYTWDERVQDGSCFNTFPISLAFSLGTIAADLIFVILSWFFLLKLDNPRCEKAFIATCVSVGLLFAAAAGTVRIMLVEGDRETPVTVLIWSQVETCATLICVGTSLGLPLWRITWNKFFSSEQTNLAGSRHAQQRDIETSQSNTSSNISDSIGLLAIRGGDTASTPGQVRQWDNDDESEKISQWGDSSRRVVAGDVCSCNEQIGGHGCIASTLARLGEEQRQLDAARSGRESPDSELVKIYTVMTASAYV